MGYMSMGAVALTDFNSTKYPGICNPSNFETLDKFKELQRQANRLAQARGIAKIAVDGSIGPGTIGIMKQLLPGSGMTCNDIAIGAEAFTAQLRILADQAGVSKTVSGPTPVTPPKIVTQAGVDLPAPSGMFGEMSTGVKVAAAGLLVVAGFMLFGPKSKKRR